jgi:hypothetical protein
MTDFPTALLALVTGFGALTIWSVELVRVLVDRRNGRERRSSWLVMCLTAMVVSVGTLASAMAIGMARGVVILAIDPMVLSFVASIGRGALFTAGVLVLLSPRPER